MADIFFSQDARKLLRGKRVLIFGDSNIRVLYKDIVCILTQNRMLTEEERKGKVEQSFLGDKLVRGSVLTKGRSFQEDRLFKNNEFHIEFHFVTKCYNKDIEDIFLKVKNHRLAAPDIIIMNSTLWDVARWGSKGVDLFKKNLNSLMLLFQASLPKSTLVIWLLTLPLAAELYGGFLIQQIEFTKFTMRFEVMEANMYAHQVITKYGYDVLDLHYNFRLQVHRRVKDGMHWSGKAMRHMTNLIFTHISLAWNVPLPGHFEGSELTKYKVMEQDETIARNRIIKVPHHRTTAIDRYVPIRNNQQNQSSNTRSGSRVIINNGNLRAVIPFSHHDSSETFWSDLDCAGSSSQNFAEQSIQTMWTCDRQEGPNSLFGEPVSHSLQVSWEQPIQAIQPLYGAARKNSRNFYNRYAPYQ